MEPFSIKNILSSASFIWAGRLLGVLFVATPVKFLAPSLPPTQALDVGRWTFHVLAIIEWALFLLFVVTVLAGRMRLGANRRATLFRPFVSRTRWLLVLPY